MPEPERREVAFRAVAAERGVSPARAAEILADLVAGDWITDREIAAKVGVHVATLERWKRRPEFRARVEAIVEVHRAELWRRAHGELDRCRRVEALP